MGITFKDRTNLVLPKEANQNAERFSGSVLEKKQPRGGVFNVKISIMEKKFLRNSIAFQVKIKLSEGFCLISGGFFSHLKLFRGFPGGAVVKNPPANAGDTGSRPGPGRSHVPRSN